MLSFVKELPRKNGERQGLYTCICGKETIVFIQNAKRGHTKSCGCLKGLLITQAKIKHGLRHHLIYNTWKMMIARTTNPKATSYENYGGRGIKVYSPWFNIQTFLKNTVDEIGERPSRLYCLDRIDNNGDYCPGNIQWITRADNARKQHH